MIILERSTSIVSSVYFLSSFFLYQKIILHEWEKDYTCIGLCLDWCLITWQTKRKSWWEKIQCNRFCFISVVRILFSIENLVLRILFSIKNLGDNIKNILEINLWRKRTFCKKFQSTWNFSWFFRIINVNQCFFTLNILIKWIVDMDIEKKIC